MPQSLSGRNRTSDPVIADIYSHMLYQLSYAELAADAGQHQTGHLAQWQSTGLVNLGSRVRSSQWPSFFHLVQKVLVVVMLGLEPRTFALSERRSTD